MYMFAFKTANYRITWNYMIVNGPSTRQSIFIDQDEFPLCFG